MTELPNVLPVPIVTDADVRAVLDGLAPGRYTTRDLYPRYEVWARNQENHRPVGRKAFGVALRRVLGPPVGYAHGHVNVFQL